MSGAIESLGRIRAKGLALLAVVFVAGALAGAALDRWWTASTAPPSEDIPVGPMVRDGRLPPAFERIDLTDEQRERIEAILATWQPRVDSLLGTTLPALRAVTDSVRQEVEAVLTPEQRERLAELLPEGPPSRVRPPFDGPGPRDRKFVPPAERPGFEPPMRRRSPVDTAAP
ncbi:MAG: hypothetical protein R3199_06630 [Gemmatimonadota bacterium]|nr:hypothetical protein [Gemmatimonadota bacterium]